MNMIYFEEIIDEIFTHFKNKFTLRLLILFIFLLTNFLLFAQKSDLIFNDIGKGNQHKYWEKYSLSQKTTSNKVLSKLYEDKVLNHKDSLVLFSTNSSQKVTHNRFQQFHDGVPVEGAYFSFHSINDILIAFNGTLVSSLPNYNTTSIIDSVIALQKAKAKINATKYAWEDKVYLELVNSVKECSKNSIMPNPTLTLLNTTKGVYILTYKMEIHSIEPQGRYTIYVNAYTGDIAKVIDNLQHANSSATCSTVHHGMQSIPIDLNGSNYELTDKLGITNRNMETYLLPNNSITYANALIPSMNSSIPTADCFNLSSNLEKAALDIHWATSIVYDFFNSLGINSFDNNGSLIKSYTNYGNNNNSNNNAFWNGSFFTYGAGGGNPFPGPVATLDVAAHEFGHALTEKYGSGLQYYGESGAINESISDMIASSVEHFTIDNNSAYAGLFYSIPNEWNISKLNGGGLRDMSNPNLFGDPDTYQGTNWASTTGLDHGGVHTNSGVGNYWFYLLANPNGSNGNQLNDNGTTFNVASIGFKRHHQCRLLYRRL